MKGDKRMKKIKVKKYLVFLLVGLLLFGSFSGTLAFAEEVNSNNIQTEVTNDPTNNGQEQTENVEQQKQDSINQDSINTVEDTLKAENKDENIKIQSNDEGTEYVKAVLKDTGDTIIWSRKSMSMYAGVQLSGVDTQLNGAYMIVTMPSQYFNPPKASTGASLKKDPTIETNEDNYAIRYDYPNLSGGMKVELPITFEVKYLPDSYLEIPVKATLYDSAGNIKDEKTLVFATSRTFTLEFPVINNNRNDYFVDSNPIDGDYTSDDLNQLSFIERTISYKLTGNTLPDSIKMVLTLKNGVYFDEEKNKDWVYESTTRTATLIIDSPENKESSFNIYLKYPHWKYNTSGYNSGYAFSLKACSIYKGNEVYSTYSNSYYQHITKASTTRSMELKDMGLSLDDKTDYKSMRYDGREILTHSEANKKRIIFSKTQIYDNASTNLSTGTLTSNNYVHQIDFTKDTFDLNFVKLYVDSSQIANDEIKKNFKKNNILYGIKEDGSKVEIEKNIEMDTEINIPAQTKDTKYQTLQLYFPDGFNLVRKWENGKWDDRTDTSTPYFDIYIGTNFFKEDWDDSLLDYVNDYKKRFLAEKVIYSNEINGNNVEISNDAYYDNYYHSMQYPFSYLDIELQQVRFYGYGLSKTITEGGYYETNASIYVNRGNPNEYTEDELMHIKNGKMYYLLSDKLEHANNQKTYLKYRNLKTNNDEEIEVTPTKIENYKNSGKTAYVIDLPQLDNWNDRNYLYFYFPVRPSSNATTATQVHMDVYFSWENNDRSQLPGGNVKDAYDMNENNKTDDIICKNTTSYSTVKNNQRVEFSGRQSESPSYITLGTENRIAKYIHVDRDNDNAKRYIKNGKMYFVMPKGYVHSEDKKANINYYDKEEKKYKDLSVEVETITNFKNTGKTAYIMNLPEHENLKTMDDKRTISFYLPFHVTNDAPVGESSIETYFAWENNSYNEIPATEDTYYKIEDTQDLSNNGKGNYIFKLTDYYYYTLRDQTANFTLTGNANMMLGDTAVIRPKISIDRKISSIEKRHIKNGKMYFIVPEGYEYAKGKKTSISYYDTVDRRQKEVEVTPKVMYNFKNTGKTAYVMELPDYDELDGYDDTRPTSFSFPVRPTINAPQGNSTVDVYFAWDNNKDAEIGAGNNKVKDTYDLNDDGSIEDYINHSTYTITFLSNVEVAGVHRVGNTLDGLNGSGSSIDLGSKFYYGMDILNLQNDTTVKSLSIMEVLPYKNDKSIIPDKTGTYTDRESQYRVHINGPVKVLKDGNLVNPEDEGYEVVYSTETPENEGFSANLNKTFKKDVTDWSKVTMFKITMKKGTEISEKGSMRFVVEALVPDDDSIADEDIAQASFAYVSSSMAGANFKPSNYIETTSIASQVARYQISGNVYMDYNINGSHDTDEKVFSGLKVGLYDEDDKKVQGTNTDEDGNYVFDFLTRGNYTVKVEEKPAGMAYPDEANHYDDIFPVAPQTRVAATGKNSLDKTGSSEVLTMDPDTKKRSLEMGLEAQLQEINVEKQWLGPEGSNSVDVTLHGLDQEKKLSVTADKGWNDRFIHLRKVDENGRPIIYTLTEDTDIDGYKKQIEKQDGKFIVKNINIEKVNVPVQVRWIGKESKDTEITLVETQTKQTVNADSHWQYDFTDLYKYDQGNGNEISYTIEAKDIEGYTKEITGDMTNGYVVTYTNVEKIKVPVTVKWLGKEGQEAEITLVQGNNKQVVNADDNWKYSFKNLFKYDQTTGEAINYTIEAKDVEGYTKEITGDVTKGFVVIYRDQEKRNVSVSKQWVGEEKENVTVHLLKESNKEETMTLDSTNSWQGEFKDLYKYDQEDGHIIEYTVEEDEVEGYKTGISGNMDLGYTITNTITGRVSIPVTKEFIGPQIENVTVDLYANDVKVDSIELNDTNQWQYTFTDKEKYEDGKEIVYTIKEHDIKNYKSKITGNALDGYVITNTNVEKREIPVKIKWIGKEGQETEVILVQEKDQQNITADNDWKYSFKDLYQYDQETGEEINYTIKAKDIEGYTKEITGDKENGYVVTYTNIEKLKVPVTIKWIGKEGTEAEVSLGDNNQTITSKDNWKYVFSNLYRYDQTTGKEISYEFDAKDIEGYTKEITGDLENGYVVTYTNIEKVKVPVRIDWKGKEGTEAEVSLGDNNQTITSKDNWKYIFSNLYRYDQTTGKEISYTIKAKDIEGYTKEITGNMTDGYVVTYTNIEKVKVPVRIDWKGKEGTEAEVSLGDNNQTITSKDNWKYIFSNLYRYDQTTGKEISYTIKAKDIEGYTKEITGDKENGYVVTYTNIEKVKVPVRIDWKGKEGTEAEVSLGDNNQTITSKDNWKYIFSNLYRYDQTTGKEISYEFDAKDIEGYTKEITGDLENGYVVTYTEIIPTIEGHENKEPGILEKILGPQTGDQAMISGFIILLLASIGGILLIKRKKKD